MRKNENVIYISLVSLIMLITFIILLALSITKINKWKKDNEENNFIKDEIHETAIRNHGNFFCCGVM